MMTRDNVMQSNQEVDNLRYYTELTKDVPGDLAEIGVCLGGTASVIYDVMNPNKRLYLFDTFELGFVGVGENDPNWIREPQPDMTTKAAQAYSSIVEYFKDKPQVTLVKGSFPQSGQDLLKDKKFSFVHLDVDIYLPTKESLEFFYPRMSVGGVFVIHDYMHQDLKGVKKAVDEFFADKIERPTFRYDPDQFMSQVMFIKL